MEEQCQRHHLHHPPRGLLLLPPRDPLWFLHDQPLLLLPPVKSHWLPLQCKKQVELKKASQQLNHIWKQKLKALATFRLQIPQISQTKIIEPGMSSLYTIFKNFICEKLVRDQG